MRDNPFPRRSGHRPVRLALLLLAVLAALLVQRLIVVGVVNGDRLRSEEVEGLQFHGRYYPIEKVCLVVDDAELEDGLKGDAALDDEDLMATGNRFEVSDFSEQHVSMECGWRNWKYDRDPKVFFLFSAFVYTEPVEQLPACTSDLPGVKAETVALGRYTSCRQDDGFEVTARVVDDNAVIRCRVKAVDESLLPALAQAMQQECEHFIDQLARSRPTSYWGNGFWTVR